MPSRSRCLRFRGSPPPAVPLIYQGKDFHRAGFDLRIRSGSFFEVINWGKISGENSFRSGISIFPIDAAIIRVLLDPFRAQ